MAETSTTPGTAPAKFTPGTPAWVDSTSTDTEKSKAFYTALFGWTANDLGEEAGNYVMFELEGAIVAATGPVQGEGQPAAWSVYFATDDTDETARKVEAGGGKVIFPPLEVMDQGKMAVFADNTGAFFSVWQAAQMPGLGRIGAPNTFGWCELNTRGVDKAAEFYSAVFDWNAHKPDNGEGALPYTEWQLNGESFGGGIDMADTGMPEGIPPHWLVYFAADDIDAVTAKVTELGGQVMMGPKAYPGGMFSVVADPVGAAFGLMTPRK